MQKINYKYINRFAKCWVPDEEGEINLAGELSHPVKMPATTVQYIGALSRLEKTGEEEKKGHLLIVLSGPEPQRTILENKIIKDIAHYIGTASIVRGLPGALTVIPSTNTIRFYNHLSAGEMNKEMDEAEYIISRSGYSTIMDITKLKKKTILIPTPGQTEQEYLAKYLHEKKMVLRISQNSFSLSSALQLARSFLYNIPYSKNENQLRQSVSQFVRSLQKH
jgi:UDP-N-acetylglucosamine transferase subunit ALG13